MHKAWIAGIFDGEGSVSLTHSNHNRIQVRVSVTNTHKATVEVFKQFGGGIWVGKTWTTRRVLYRWAVCGNKAIKFLKYIRPHLLTKRSQADVAIWLYATVPVVGQHRRWKQNEHIIQEAKQRFTKAKGR